MSFLLLSLLETRVLGVLVEKERTVPDSYPLTLNSLVSGCNQKNNRDPLLSATDDEVQLAVDSLKSRSLIIESSGSRVMRYAHNVSRVLRIPDQAVALLTALLLRGPQTAAELRINAERLHKFADSSAVEGFLDELANRVDERGDGSLVVKLSRLPGAREARWMHLLSGVPEDVASDPDQISASSTTTATVSVTEIATLKAQIARLDQECAELRELVEKLYRELGVSR
jgi:uncharacterized protein